MKKFCGGSDWVCVIAILVCLQWLANRGAVAGVSMLSDQGSTFNLTSAGFAWVTTMNGEDLTKRDVVADGDAQKTLPVKDDVEMGAGFASMDSMLQWAIDHSDPEKLQSKAQEVKGMTTEELEKRQADLKEVMEEMRMKSDADLMKISLADLENNTSSAAERQRALQELLILVEPIDNAIDLNKLGGLIVVVGELDREEEDLRTTAAWVLGKACQNNLVVQKQILKLGALPKLMKMAGSGNGDEAVKAFFAVSAVIRNFPLGQESFYEHGGAFLLQVLLNIKDVDVRLQKKALVLVADLAEQQMEAQDQVLELSDGLLRSVVKLTESQDLDTQEKALMTMHSLAGISTAIRGRLKNVCEAEATLERLRFRFQEQVLEPDLADSVRDLEVLRHELAESLLLQSEEHNNA